jgi:ring-1,2-phenylacetyl-CoA epoxidase subunit PaaC
MNETAFALKVLAFADDELILGQRNSEWTGHAPILEEDIAFANIALDEMGHAQLWYELYQEFTDTEPDYLVFFRSAIDYRNAQFVELPKGDWAFSMLRQYLFDVYENVLLAHLVNSSHARVAEIAAKIRSEEMYHLRHTSNWVKRLGLGTEESHRRMQTALHEMWTYALQLFVLQNGEPELIDANIFPDMYDLQIEWEKQIIAHLSVSSLIVPETREPIVKSRTAHTEDLKELLHDMQQVARSEVYGVEW